jgi:hypothetical protein
MWTPTVPCLASTSTDVLTPAGDDFTPAAALPGVGSDTFRKRLENALPFFFSSAILGFFASGGLAAADSNCLFGDVFSPVPS